MTNWKAHEENVRQFCSSISEISIISNSCNVIFHASAQEILLPATWISSGVEDIILSYKSLIKMVDSKTLEFLIGTGCRLCGIPIASRFVAVANSFLFTSVRVFFLLISLIKRMFTIFLGWFLAEIQWT